MRRARIASFAITATVAFTPIAAAQPAAIYDWTGPYVGIAGGYSWGASKQTDSGINLGDGNFALRGGIVGGTLGYNWQNGPWVFGLEGDYAWAGISGSSDVCGASSFVPHVCGTKLQSLGTLRARFGHNFGATGNWFLYATGGLAMGELHAWDDFFPASGNQFRVGWTAGAGVEAGLTRNWTAKFEYLYVDLGSRAMFDVVPGTPETVSFNSSIVRLGLNYRF